MSRKPSPHPFSPSSAGVQAIQTSPEAPVSPSLRGKCEVKARYVVMQPIDMQ